MVRATLAALIVVWASPAPAQTVDWTTAGGGLFGPEPPARTDEAPENALDVIVMTPALGQPMMAEIEAAALAHGLDPKLLHALVLQESAYNPRAVSPVGAAGLTQLMPATARDLGVRDRFNPVENLHGGANYLAQQIVRFADLELALAAYNSGPSRVARLGRVPDISETRAYVSTVISCYLALSAGRKLTSSSQCRKSEPVR